MMNWNKKLVIILSLLLLVPLASFAEEIPVKIISGFNSGDASLIASFFKRTVELNINSTENVYSSQQAELILKDFFKTHTPESFKIIHKGGQGESKYAIGSLKTSSGSFRVTMLIKTANNEPYIHQLRIEKDGV